jgi:hypothetical protein
MASRFLEAVADSTERDAIIPGVLPGKAGIVYNRDTNALEIQDPDSGTFTSIPIGSLDTAVEGVAAGYRIARGVHTTLDADDTVVTGLTTVVAVVCSLESDPVAGASKASALVGDQAGSPAAGSIQIKTWEADETAGTTFTKLVGWIAVGT